MTGLVAITSVNDSFLTKLVEIELCGAVNTTSLDGIVMTLVISADVAVVIAGLDNRVKSTGLD